MILSTTPTIEGKQVTVYLGVIGAEIIFGVTFLKDWIADATDFWGGRNGVYEEIFQEARQKALADIGARAEARGANAVLNIRFDYTVMGVTNGMLMVAATGTAVIVNLTKEDRALEETREQENVACHYVEIDGRKRGPFSLVQLRELLAKARIQSDASTFDDAGAFGPSVRELISPGG